MRAPPAEFDVAALVACLADGWSFEAEAAEYAAVGGGSYHWIVNGRGGARAFATVDDLDRKPWLGDTREEAFVGLRRAFDTAAALRGRGRLGFVVAPFPASGGDTVRRFGPRHTVALFPFVEGQPGEFGRYEPAERAGILDLLARLHEATPAAAPVARRVELKLAGRRRLEEALGELGHRWSDGPFSEPTRQALAGHASEIAELLALFDRLGAEVAARGDDWVVTHGEPHAGNVMRSGESYLLIDWDTVGLAPPERDLWMLVDDATDETAAPYSAATGRDLDQRALDYFRLTWDLADLASFTDLLRAPHVRTADTAKAFEAVTYYVAVRDQWAALLG